jgi:predicted metal-dependent phosphoesterase TrpH
MSIDLHVHTTMSDGTMSPTEIVAYAAKKGLRGVAITDHDTANGVAEAQAAGKRLGLEVLSGIELNVRYGKRNVHLLGYLFDIHDQELGIALKRVQQARADRNGRIIDRLHDLGIDLDFTEISKKYTGGQIGRPHIARLLLQKKVVATIDEAFDQYLGANGSAYIGREVLQISDAIRLINNAGGLAVLAHPSQLAKEHPGLRPALKDMIAMGLDGIEAYYPSHSRNFRDELLRIAAENNLLVTGGSDYHGDIRPGTTLAGGKNVYVPDSILSEMKKRISD